MSGIEPKGRKSASSNAFCRKKLLLLLLLLLFQYTLRQIYSESVIMSIIGIGEALGTAAALEMNDPDYRTL